MADIIALPASYEMKWYDKLFLTPASGAKLLSAFNEVLFISTILMYFNSTTCILVTSFLSD